MVRLDSKEERKKVMERKGRLKGTEVWIMEDLTWKERRKRWLLKEIAMEEARRGNKMQEESDGIMINGDSGRKKGNSDG